MNLELLKHTIKCNNDKIETKMNEQKPNYQILIRK